MSNNFLDKESLFNKKRKLEKGKEEESYSDLIIKNNFYKSGASILPISRKRLSDSEFNFNVSTSQAINHSLSSSNWELSTNEKELTYQNNSINEIENSKIIIENVLSNYREPTLIGLQNVGATCFMNSVLQCLSQTEKLTIYFLEQNHRERIINNNISLLYSDNSQLAPRYLELLENLWKKSSAKKYYAPYNFMNTVTNMNPLFKRGEAGDAKDFIIFVLEQIHKELKKPVNIKNNKMIQVSDQLNQYDKQNALYNFFNEFSRETSIISDLFFGFIETNTICLNCKNYFNSRNRPNPIPTDASPAKWKASPFQPK